MSKTIPSGWRVLTLGESAINVNKKYRALAGKNPRYVGLEHIAPESRIIREWGYAEDITSTKTVFQRGDTLFGKLRPNLKKVSYADFSGICSTDILALRANDEVTPEYLYRILSSETVVSAAVESSFGNVMPRTSWVHLSGVECLQPPLPEQQKIAAILSSVDDVIEKTHAQIGNWKDLKTGMMQELLTKGVGHTEFKDSPVGRIPVSWKIQSLKSLCRRITDGTHQSVKTSDSGKIPFLYVSCIRNGEILWDKASGLTESDYTLASKGRVASPGDILYTAVGSYGHAALVETDQRFSFQRHIAFIQPDKSTVDPRYLVSVLNSTLGRTQADRFAIGNAQLSVTLGDLGTFMIPTPPLHEQHKIAKTIGAIISNIHEHETKLGSLLNLKKALMQDLLTGKVRVKVDQKESAVA